MVHITDYACFHEQGYYTPGDTGAPVYPTRAGRIGVAICYDRHYPEYMRALAVAGADLVVVPQAGAVGEWPDGLYEAEMRVAAFQNGYHVALCNRVGRGGVPDVCRRVVRLRARRRRHRARGGGAGHHSVRRPRSRRGVTLARTPAVPSRSPARAVRRVDRTMSSVQQALIAGAAVLIVLIAACSGISVQTAIYQTLDEARLAGAIDQGWVPRGLPASSAGSARRASGGRPRVGQRSRSIRAIGRRSKRSSDRRSALDPWSAIPQAGWNGGR